jgi:predicted DNA-binding transcriptional regulator YafY
VQVPPDEVGPQVDPELLTQLAALCRDREQLRFDYLAHGGSETLRRVEPHRLVNWGRRWYLVAFDLEKQDWRTFRVDRVRPRIPTGPRFTPRELPEDGDVAAYVSRRVSAAAWRYRASVEVAVPASMLAEQLTPAVGAVEPIDEERCLLQTGADSVQSLAVHLSLLDVDFVVRDGPPELTAYLERLAERYRRATSS